VGSHERHGAEETKMNTRYLCNVVTIAMAPAGGTFQFVPITPREALHRLTMAADEGRLVQAIGHAQTAAFAQASLEAAGGGPGLATMSRISVQLDDGDDLIVCQYIGPRLSEGVTVLPEGAELRWYLVTYRVMGF
jgi:hypothetical protein